MPNIEYTLVMDDKSLIRLKRFTSPISQEKFPLVFLDFSDSPYSTHFHCFGTKSNKTNSLNFSIRYI